MTNATSRLSVVDRLFAVEDLRAAASRWDERAALLAALRQSSTPSDGELVSQLRATMLRRVADALEMDAYGDVADLSAGDHFAGMPA